MIKYLTPRSEEEINVHLASLSLRDLFSSMDFFHMDLDLDFAKTELRKRLHIIDIKLTSTGFNYRLPYQMTQNVIFNIHKHIVYYYTMSMYVNPHDRKHLLRTLKKENINYKIEDEEICDNFAETVMKIQMKIYKN